MINDKSQDSTAKSLMYDELLHYEFIIHCAGERIFKICEHLAKLQGKWLIVSYAPFALDFCPERCRTRWISKITCLLHTETVTDCCYVNTQINMSLLSTNIRLLQTSFDLLTDGLVPSVTDCLALLVMYGILLQHLFFFITAVLYSR